MTVLNFLNKYWITAVLLFILITLFYQSFIINQFPTSLTEKKTIIDKQKQANNDLINENKIKALELKTHSMDDKEILESQARYRFGLVKKGEHYYQISEPE